MFFSWLDPHWLTLGLLGLAAPLLGLAGLLLRPSGWRRVLALSSAALALGLPAALGAGTSAPARGWLPFLVPAAACVLVLLLQVPGLDRALVYVFHRLQRPTLLWVLLLVTGPLLALHWAYRGQPTDPEWQVPPGLQEAHRPVLLREIGPSPLTTDAGRPLPIYHRAKEALAPAALEEMDSTLLDTHELEEEVIRTGPPTEDYNCHGWVFTNGRYWLQGAEVELILEDNGYEVTAEASPGDLIVYRDFGGHISHTGIVRAAVPGGLVLIESKWGKGGRFIHSPQALSYMGSYTYYCSPRPGHLLHGLSPKEPPTPGTVVTSGSQQPSPAHALHTEERRKRLPSGSLN